MFNQLMGVLNGIGADSLVSLLLLGLICSIFLNLYAFHSLRSHESLLPGGKRFAAVVKKFLLNQQTKTSLQTKAKRLSPQVRSAMRLREAYLAIEIKCIERGLDTDEYWNLLHSRLTKLMNIFSPKEVLSPLRFIEEKVALIHRELELAPDTVRKKDVKASLDKLYLACVENEFNPDKIEKINDKLSALFFNLRSANYRQAAGRVELTANHAKQGKSLTEQLDSTANAVMAHTKDMQDAGGEHESLAKIHDYSSQIASSAGNLGENYDDLHSRVEDMGERLAASTNETEVHGVDRDLIDLSDEMVEASEREIERLKALVAEKRTIIRDLEEQLASGASLSDDGDLDPEGISEGRAGVSEEDMTLLRKNLRESEQCIEMLEYELDLLKQKSDHLDEEDPGVSEETLAMLQQSLDKAHEEIANYQKVLNRKEMIFSFLRESVDSSSLADAGIFFYQCLKDLGYANELLINADGKKMELNEKGSLAVSQKLLIENMRVGEFNSSERDKKVVARYANFGGVLRKDDGSAFTQEEKQTLSDLFVICDKIFARIKMTDAQSSQRREVAKLVNGYKYMVSEMDDMIDALIKKIKGEVSSSFRQVEDVGRSAGLQARVIAAIKSLEDELQADLAGDSRVKIRLRKSQLEFLKNLEDLES
ncbi:hypothetical protein [Teredinibacter turnerae]|uniref:hypothetical protein n=1 Tax=Teredinibacter turnerae TaxID=2426 RepID=UPI000381212D|nr:hypothetical protein [Teredinibacter turnerae]